jgi:hypothetical protein
MNGQAVASFVFSMPACFPPVMRKETHVFPAPLPASCIRVLIRSTGWTTQVAAIPALPPNANCMSFGIGTGFAEAAGTTDAILRDFFESGIRCSERRKDFVGDRERRPSRLHRLLAPVRHDDGRLLETCGEHPDKCAQVNAAQRATGVKTTASA